MTGIDKKKILSMISLLDDDDQRTIDLISDEVLAIGEPAMPHLLDALEKNIDEVKTNRLRGLLNQINLELTTDKLIDWKKNNSRNLYQGMIILSKYRYPDLDVSVSNTILNKIRQDLWLEVNDNLTALEKIKVVNNVFFNIHNFKANTTDYYSLENNFINDVLKSKNGK